MVRRPTLLRLAILAAAVGAFGIANAPKAEAEEAYCNMGWYCVGGGTPQGQCIVSEGSQRGCDSGGFCLGGGCCTCGPIP
jgi:hypothetical protein